MAKNKSDESTTNEVATTEQAATTANAPTPAVSDDRFKKVTIDGVVMNRKDFILDCWQNKKWSRGQIAKHLTDLRSVENGGDGKKVPYQIVFATTKGKPGGPDPVATPAAATETATS